MGGKSPTGRDAGLGESLGWGPSSEGREDVRLMVWIVGLDIGDIDREKVIDLARLLTTKRTELRMGLNFMCV